MKRAARFGAWAYLGSMLVLVAPALAGSPPGASQPNRAALLRAGADAARAKNWAACIEAYDAAEALESSPETRGQRGICEEAAGRDVEAFRDLSAAMFAPGADPSSDQNKRVGDALARVTTRVAVVFLASDPPDASFVIDGRPHGKAEGRQVALSPGKHTFAAKLAGYKDQVEDRDLVGGSNPSVHLVLTRLGEAVSQAVAASAPRVEVAPPPHVELRAPWYAPAWTPRGLLVTLTYASAATSIASWAATGILEYDRASLGRGLARDACSPVALGAAGGYVDNPSRPAQCDAIHERASQRDTSMDIAIGASAGTLVFGVLAGLAIRSELRAAPLAIQAVARPDGGGLVLGGVW